MWQKHGSVLVMRAFAAAEAVEIHQFVTMLNEINPSKCQQRTHAHASIYLASSRLLRLLESLHAARHAV